MAYLLVHHKVKDFAAWKPFYDQDAAHRKASGCKGGLLFRSADDPNEIVILFEWRSHEEARTFASSVDLLDIMSRAGVIGKPDINFLDRIEKIKV
jgi:quinol monooxygenase YgiN